MEKPEGFIVKGKEKFACKLSHHDIGMIHYMTT